jgi:hypothetical protein
LPWWPLLELRHGSPYNVLGIPLYPTPDPRPRYVSDPSVNASRRTRGTDAAHQDARGIPAEPAANARRLRTVMERRGFQAFVTEHWLFDWPTWQALPVVR